MDNQHQLPDFILSICHNLGSRLIHIVAMKKLVNQNGCIDVKKVIENEVLVTFIDIKVFISVSIAPHSQSPSSHRLLAILKS